MDIVFYLGALRADGAALATAARAGLDASVPSCPGWSVADLVEHTGRVHRHTAERVRRRVMQRSLGFRAEAPPASEVVEWFEDGVEEVARVLAEANLDEPVWNWSVAAHRAGFWPRRMAQETAIHRWDAQAAHGQARPIDAGLAVDGIDELLDVFLPTDLAEQPTAHLHGAVHLHCTDRPAEWLVEVENGELRVRREHAKGAVAVRAAASDVVLLLWKRNDPTGVEVFGDATLLSHFLSLTDLD
jgi:uncharacterized protein (TIGR03083 family)